MRLLEARLLVLRVKGEMSFRTPLSHMEGQESKAGAFSRHPSFQRPPGSLNYEEGISSVCVRGWRRPVKGNGNPRGSVSSC